jgi:TatD DNase family protein
MTRLIDSHVHLDDAAFDVDRDDVLARARAADVDALVVPAVDRSSWDRIAVLQGRYAGVHPAYGLHPLYMDRHRPEHLEALAMWLSTHRAVAVGEIGLDFHYGDADAQAQRACFQQQLELARTLDLPVIVHARRALEEVIQTLRAHPGLRGVVHSFSGSLEQARRLWRLGFHLGIGGPVTYERAQRLRRIVAQMPLEFLLLESDAPDQPGAAHRGQRNEPAHMLEVLRCVAGLRDRSTAEIAAVTTANAARLFGLGLD